MNTTHVSHRRATILAFIFVATASYGARLVAGDSEVVCGGFPEHAEAWVPTPSLPCVVNVAASLSGQGPYFPGGHSTVCGAGSTSTPGMQSVIQAMITWNTATIPGTTILGSSFSFAFPTTVPNMLVSSTDGNNEINLYPAQNWFRTNGFSGALAASIVTALAASGHITDADLVVNTTQIVGGTPTSALWCFLEYNTAYTQWVVSDTANNLGGAPAPLFGFAGLQGTITHELGHIAGLGHSVIDSSASSTGSGFPTMFPFAQAEPLLSTLVNNYFGQCTPPNFSGTIVGTIVGRSAQTMKYDDVVALSRQYFSAGFGTLGKITGTVKDSIGTPILGAAVVAIPKATSPTPMELQRIQTLSYAGGNYSIGGLTAGDYYVYIEPVDQDPLGNSDPQYYFRNVGDVPNYVDLTGAGGCITYVPFQTEVYNSADQLLEVQSAASTITLTSSGGTVSTASNVNFVISMNPNILTVGVVNGGVSPAYHSPRGVRFALPAGGAGTRVVEFVIHAGAAFAGLTYRVEFSDVRTTNLVSTLFNPTQLDQIIQTTNTSFPGTLSGTLNASGDAVFQLGFGSALQYSMVFAQADVGPVGAEVYSNCTAIWVAQ